MGVTNFSEVDSANGYKVNGVPTSHYNYFYEDFKVDPVTSKVAGGAATGTAGDLNVMGFERNIIRYSPKGTQTILAPVLSSLGLNINMDQTDNDGVELWGSSAAITRARSAFTVGTSENFFFSVKFSIADVSGTDDCAIGFRRVQAQQANFDDYTDAAVLNVISGDITIETILNNAATVVTDTTQNWADAETYTLTVKVSKNGVVTYEINGVVPTVTAAFTFDNGDVIVPVLFFLNAADVADAVNLLTAECGAQEFRAIV